MAKIPVNTFDFIFGNTAGTLSASRAAVKRTFYGLFELHNRLKNQTKKADKYNELRKELTLELKVIYELFGAPKSGKLMTQEILPLLKKVAETLKKGVQK